MTRYQDLPDLAGKTRIAQRCVVAEADVDSLAARCVAALESSSARSTIVLTTAARLHGLWLPAVPDEIHIAASVPDKASRQMTRTRRPQFVAHRLQIASAERVLVNGVETTSIALTWFQLARVLSLPDLVAAGDCALRSGVTIKELERVTSRMSHARGVRRARQALPLLDRRTRSRPESHLRVAVVAPDLPAFEVNTAVYRDDEGWLAEPDLSLVGAKLALEYQGGEHGGEKRMRKDITRAKDMRDEGWLVHPYGPAQVFGRPWEIRAEVRSDIRKRAPHLLRDSLAR